MNARRIKKFLSTHQKGIIDLVFILIIIGVIASYYQPALLFSETITTGGDMASDYYPAQYMNDYIIPSGKITGWSPGWYNGFPLLQFYFPAPFVLMYILSFFMSLQVAFKLVTAGCVFLIPISAYIMFRLMNFKFPAPILASVMTLAFLFMEANSMWGGNIPSTLAGEFSYSFSISLSLLFFGTVWKGLERSKSVKKSRYWVLSTILFALVVFFHVYGAIFAFFTTAFFLFTKDRKPAIKYLFKTYLLAILLIAFWILPMLSNLAYTTPYADTWSFPIEQLFPLSIVAFFPLLIGLVPLLKKQDSRIMFFLFSILAMIVFFIIAEPVGVVNIRFLPFIQLTLLLLAGVGISQIIKIKSKTLRRKLKKLRSFNWALVPIISIIIIAFVISNVSFIHYWIQWNYSGFEGKPVWNEYREINEFIAGDQNDPRVIFEHSSKHNSFGTVRAFESLPLFSGRSNTEGLFMQSSLSSPFVFYLQSETSQERSCPFWKDYPCASYDLENGTRHMKMFNVNTIIAIHEKTKAALSNNSEYKLIKTVNDYQIFELTTGPNQYITVPDYEPVEVSMKNWKLVSYEWFKGDNKVPLVFKKGAPELPSHLPIKPINNNCNISEHIGNETISFTTDCVGKPHIISISYYPAWKVVGAESVELVSPSSMIVYPTQENVQLYFGETELYSIGRILSIIGFLALTFFIISSLARRKNYNLSLRSLILKDNK